MQIPEMHFEPPDLQAGLAVGNAGLPAEGVNGATGTNASMAGHATNVDAALSQ